MDRRIYFDHAATTPLDPRVLEAMLPCLTGAWGNPSSIYAEAREARRQLSAARRAVAELLGARPAEIVFTSGGSESDNLAVLGIARAGRARGNHVVTSATEHHAVLHATAALEAEGFRVTTLPVDAEGVVDPGLLAEAVGPDTVLVSIMTANNETGTLQPITELVRAAKGKNPQTLFHTDAVQAAGMLELDVNALGVDALSLAAHKFYGPKGAGVLYVRGRTPLAAHVLGGAQENERRAGTENVAAAAGCAEALRLACAEMDGRISHVRTLRDRLLDEIPARVTGAVVTGPLDRDRRLANNASFCFKGIASEMLLVQLDLAGFAVSSGSACTTGSLEPSHVLTAMGIPDDLALSSLRLTLGVANTCDDVDALLACLPGFIAMLRDSNAQSTDGQPRLSETAEPALAKLMQA